ncbi:uncharacterized protein LOC100284601 [Zea mays]|jgi:hypothetical protein|uniref:Ethylene-responsive transcription factor ERF014 n=1 Tax=Zea mays TaxID=4577 RepID=A0A1D6NSE3_MAIZE|nr:uncharacterized protein LOC100284601 [Zea mays]AQL01177.1 Ethylene-responsive transcription factor ERF014 [Zea mays]|eukprot:NP_001150968.2 DNA binding protein [Zea mays]
MVKTATATAAARHGGAHKRTYKGVRMRSWGSWVSEVRAPGQKTRIWLGSHSTAEAAARAYDAALLCLRGSAAAPDLNFPPRRPLADGLHPLPPAAMSPKAIQRVAAAAAACCAPQSNGIGSACCAAPCAPPSNGIGSACGHAETAPALSGSPPSSDSDVSSPEAGSTASSDGELARYGDGDGDGGVSVDYGSLADIDAFFQSPKCMDDDHYYYAALMDPCGAFFAPAPSVAADDDAAAAAGCWEDGDGIALWSFSFPALDC